tara:strand:+ start:153 stop:839 length:687 start_codon:yes stop_codon:yes gene_type:complete
MSSASACASARRKRAASQPVESKQIKDDKSSVTVKKTVEIQEPKYTPLQVLTMHENKIKTIEDKLDTLFNSSKSEYINHDVNNNEDKTADFIEKFTNNFNILESNVNKLKDSLLETYNTYLTATKNIILLQEKVGLLESKFITKEDVDSNNTTVENNKLLENLMNDISITNDESISIDTICNNNLTETDFIDIKNAVANEINTKKDSVVMEETTDETVKEIDSEMEKN